MVKLQRILFFLLFFSVGLGSPNRISGQVLTDSRSGQEKGKVEVVKDPLIAVLQKYRAEKNRIGGRSESTGPIDRSNMTRSTVRGFRVQIYLGPSRTDAYAEQARFMRMFRNIDSYVTYEEPNYRVKVGDFRSRSEAESLMQGLRGHFSNVFIFTEDIFIYH